MRATLVLLVALTLVSMGGAAVTVWLSDAAQVAPRGVMDGDR